MKKISLIIAMAVLGWTFQTAKAQDASDTNHVKVKTKQKVSADGSKKIKTTVKGSGTAGTVGAASNGTKPVIVNHPTTVVVDHTPPPAPIVVQAPAPEPRPTTTVTTTTTTNKAVPASNPPVKKTTTTTTHVHKTTTGAPVKKTTTTTVKSDQ